jgi:hypothetical protein
LRLGTRKDRLLLQPQELAPPAALTLLARYGRIWCQGMVKVSPSLLVRGQPRASGRKRKRGRSEAGTGYDVLRPCLVGAPNIALPKSRNDLFGTPQALADTLSLSRVASGHRVSSSIRFIESLVAIKSVTSPMAKIRLAARP